MIALAKTARDFSPPEHSIGFLFKICEIPIPSMMLSKLRTKSTYVKANIKGKRTISRIPFVGNKIYGCNHKGGVELYVANVSLGEVAE